MNHYSGKFAWKTQIVAILIKRRGNLYENKTPLAGSVFEGKERESDNFHKNLTLRTKHFPSLVFNSESFQ